jgi:hypothetical protein
MRSTVRTSLITTVMTMSVAAGLAGCSSGQEAPARQVVERFYSAVHSGQGEAACRLLAPRTAESLRSGDESCARSILRLRLPGSAATVPSRATGATQVWDREAQVRLAGDTVFLHRFAGGWLVRAAGCTPRGERPYACEVGD